MLGNPDHNLLFYFPPGVYNFTETIEINRNNVVFKGAGYTETTLKFTKTWKVPVTGAVPWVRYDFFYIKECYKIGIEDVKIDVTEPTFVGYGLNENGYRGMYVKFEDSDHCWISGVKFYKAPRHHIYILNSHHIEIRGSYFNDAYSHGGGGNGYGIQLFGPETRYCLIENNIFRNFRHAFVFSEEAKYNVVGYNYERDAFLYYLIFSYIEGQICFHGAQGYESDEGPEYNLCEGNIVGHIEVDDSHGSNGHYNTIFRNQSYDMGIQVKSVNDYVNIVNNYFGATGVDETAAGFPWIVHGNNHLKKNNKCRNTYGSTWETSHSPSYYDDFSYYHNSKPDFIPEDQWPYHPTDSDPYGNDTDNPAKDRWDAGGDKTVNAGNENTTYHIIVKGIAKLNDQPTSGIRVKIYKPGAAYIGLTDSNGNYEIEFDKRDGAYGWSIEYKYDDYYTVTNERNFYQDSNVTYEVYLDDVSLSMINPVSLYVSPDPDIENTFHNIAEAIQYTLDNNTEECTITLLPGVYTGSGNHNLSWAPINDIGHIKIIGLNPELCIIDGFNTVPLFTLESSYLSNLDKIENITIINGSPAIKITAGNPFFKNVTIINGSPAIEITAGNPFFKDVTINNSSNDNNGGAISITSSATIENCIIDNCETTDMQGGGIYIENNTTLPVAITNCKITNCNSLDAGAIYATGTGPINIVDCEISGNEIDITSDYVACYFDDCTDLQFNNNLVINNIAPNNKKTIGIFNSENVLFQNNTIADNPNQYALRVGGNSSVDISNNIITGSSTGINLWYGTAPSLTYNLVNCVNNYSSNLTPGIGSLESIDPQLDSNYIPRWETALKSPCIDSGHPDLIDPDGTRIDIGAKPAIVHRNETWMIYDNNAIGNSSVFKWLSLPALDDLSEFYDGNNLIYDGDVAEYLLADILDTTILEEVTWIPLGSSTNNPQSIHWVGNGNWNNSSHQFTSPQGYKFEVKPDLLQSVELDISGFIEAADTMIELKGNGIQNWLGYYLEEKHTVQEAFADAFDNLTSIKTQTWSAIKDANGNWVGSKLLPLSYGDMVIVECENDCTFSWNNEGGTIPVDPKTVKTFIWEEEADYMPIFVEVEEDRSVALEVAVIVNGICQGASVIEDGQATILSYILDCPDEEVEFEFYYGERADNAIISEYKIKAANGAFVTKKITIDPDDKYYQVSFREGEGVNNLPSSLSIGNYPNPFNPSTTISYALPHDTDVEIIIYNVKGQKVTKLVDESKSAGFYNAIWNGKDDSGKAQSSGIYFYRMKTDSKVINRKMMLLK